MVLDFNRFIIELDFICWLILESFSFNVSWWLRMSNMSLGVFKRSALIIIFITVHSLILLSDCIFIFNVNELHFVRFYQTRFKQFLFFDKLNPQFSLRFHINNQFIFLPHQIIRLLLIHSNLMPKYLKSVCRSLVLFAFEIEF